MFQENPFIIEGYVSPKYFCDREVETFFLSTQILNGCNVALIAQRRLGKSGLIHNMFYQEDIKSCYNVFYVDIYETKNFNEFVCELGKGILSSLKPLGRKAWEGFLDVLVSLNHTITFNSDGLPVWSVKVDQIRHPDVTLDEIFSYLANSGVPNIVAIDEFQVIANYPEKTVEAALRKRIQNCHNTRFIYSGSQRHMMSQIFASPSRPFYNSCTIMGLEPIDVEKYLTFANHHLAANTRSISDEAFQYLYDKFSGITWYIQYVLNALYVVPTKELTLSIEDVDKVIADILKRNSFVYSSLVFQLTTKQKQLLKAISAEESVRSILSQDFIRHYAMSASTIQTAANFLLSRDFITRTENGEYQVYDRFFDMWLRQE